jgi:hypothetical protein
MRRLLVLLTALALPLQAGPREVDKSPRVEGRAWILHTAAALSPADEAELEQKGIVVRHALPGGRYLARMRDGAGLDDARIVSGEPLTPEKKVHPSAVRAAAQARPMTELNVVFHRDVTFDDAREAILAAGGAIDVFALRYLPSQRLEAKLPPSAMTALAADERVFAIAAKRHGKIAAENAATAQVSHVTELYSAPYDLSGEGVAVSLFELAPAQSTHPEFGGRLTVDASGGSSGDQRHATHVAGTIGAAGLNPAAKGMAPESRIYQFCVPVSGLNQCTGDWLNIKDEKLAPLGIRIDNNSWGYIWGWESGSPPIWNEGDKYWGAYDLTTSAPIDEISIDRNVLFVHSAGNDGTLPTFDEWKSHIHYNLDTGENRPGTFCVSKNGSGTDCPTATCTSGCETALHHPQTPFDTLGTTASAKNILAVGAISTGGTIIGFSSRGPAKDGRVKPDVVARGASVYSTVPENTYATASGTSMSSPAVTGIAALLTEQWRRTFAGANPLPEQLKAVIIAGAEDLGNPGPDYTFGFGLVNAKASADLIRADEGGRRIRTLSFNQGAQEGWEIPVIVDQTQTLRVVLNWADPAIPYLGGDDIAAKALVNDLDLSITDPSGTTWRPWVLDLANAGANATRAVNTVDNTEMVEIPNAAPGVYRVTAFGTNVAEGPQKAVLVTNARTARPCFDVQELSSANNSADRATRIADHAPVFGGLCDPADVDFYSFVATQTGPVSVTIRTGDTPLRATLTGNGISRTQDIPANSTAVLNADVTTVPNAITLKIEAFGALGVEPQYSFTAEFPELRKPKRRSSRG